MPPPDALLTAVEEPFVLPVRIHRDETYQCNIRGLYPCGEGAGYAEASCPPLLTACAARNK